MAASKMKLKLVVDTKAKKVLFAEAGKDFIDILICLPSHFLMYDLLSFPVSTAVRLLKEKNMVGFLGDLYGCIENLPDAYWQTNDSKKNFLRLLLSDFGSYSQKSYSCPSCHAYVADDPNLLCPTCKKNLTNELTYVSPKSPFNIEGGFVKELVSYIVMDNLEFRPMSTKDIVTLFNNLRVEK